MNVPSGDPKAARSITLRGLAFADDEFDGQFLRALDLIPAGGADVGECFVTARRICPGDRDSWYAEWSALAERVHAIAERCERDGHLVSAFEGYLRASTYFRQAALFGFRPPLDERFVAAYRRQRAAFQRAWALPAPRAGGTRLEIVEIPYESTALEGYYVVPGGAGPFPVVVAVDGYDGTKEETWFGAVAALRRGYAVLLVDGPGQGGALVEQGLVFRPDWEAVVTPQIDWLLERSEIDPTRVVLVGRSWGGYLAPRAATAEHRVAAVIADAAQYAPGAGAASLLPPEYRDQLHTGDPAVLNRVLTERMQQDGAVDFTLNRGMLTHGLSTPLDYLRASAPYTIDGLADRISCPVLVCSGENDVRGGAGQALVDAVTTDKQFILFTNAEGAGEHCEAGAASLFGQRVFDWLDETLARR
ncbi:alpha/beta hydrolase family protein [Nakamurella flava]|uniref:alpha/beta hydrolase family protein n=1 Tax=Nakamurella flava TaxID=2576308 RepID=UPI00140B6BAE|nr:alpha/beta fold hydrolase [Nakamurella flava]